MNNKTKVIFISGGSVGMGLEAANQLSDLGHIVYVIARRSTKPKNMKNNVIYKSLDVTDDISLRNYIKEINNKNKHSIDILINATALVLAGAVEDLTLEEIKKVMDVNLLGYIRTIQAVLPEMRKKKNGRIINIGSITGLIAYPFQAAYCISKYALEGLTESIAFEIECFGIDVVIIEPGDIATDINKRRIISEKTNEKSPYINILEKSVEAAAKGEINGLSVKKAAGKIVKIALSNKVKRRYKIGMDAKLISFVKNIVPYRLYEFIMKKIFKIPKKIN